MALSVWAKVLTVGTLCIGLAACESSEDRAEAYYESAKELIAAGQADRAFVELRNVFDLQPNHRAARQLQAQIFMDRGEKRGAYGQYLRLVEQYPEDVQARVILAELAFEFRNWEELDRHGQVAEEIAADDPRVQGIALARQYRQSVTERDDPARQAIALKAEQLRASVLPESSMLSILLIDNYVRDNEFEQALSELDAAIAREPDKRVNYDQRLNILAQLGDVSDLREQLILMIEKFPEDMVLKSDLIRFYISRNEIDKAEEFLRSISSPADEDPGLFLELVRFVATARSVEAAMAEIDRGIAENPNPALFQALKGTMMFTSGQQDEAVALIESVLADMDDTTDVKQRTDVKVTLAKMLGTQGNTVGARKLVEEVLAENEAQVEALKMQAAWQIRSDDTDKAISTLRRTLDFAPEDVEAMNLMAEAYTRAGSHDLARDFLLLAVETSGHAPVEALRYAQRLVAETRLRPAEDVLLASLRRNGQNVEIISALGQIYVQLEDIGRADQVVSTLRRLGTEQALDFANSLQVRILNETGGSSQALAFIENLASGETADFDSKVTLIRGWLSVGDVEKAERMAESLVEEDPASVERKFLQATVLTSVGKLPEAEQAFQDLLAQDNSRPQFWINLIRVVLSQGKLDAVDAIVADALDAIGEDPTLMWAHASVLERQGKIDQAIAIYERLYEQNSNSIVVANNLASLLSTQGADDPDTLERAYTIARRLRGADVPVFQDTYGWIAFKRGDVEEGLEYLRSAAQGLPKDPQVQAHLGLILASQATQRDEAIDQLQKAVDLAGLIDTRPTIEQARVELQALRLAPTETPEENVTE